MRQHNRKKFNKVDFGSNIPDALPGFEKIRRYWDTRDSIYAAKILPGEFYVSAHGELITTTLGSCIAACIRDPLTGIGGMNHFMLPSSEREGLEKWKNTPVSASARYGNVAMERLINIIIANGGKRKNLEIKIFGGGNILKTKTDIGIQNINFVRKYIIEEGFTTEAEDLGGVYPRKVMYFPSSGRVKVKKLYKLHNETIFIREKDYKNKLNQEEVIGDVEFFDQ